MTCPACGSEDHRPIAVNYVECTATYSVEVQAGAEPIFGPGRFGLLSGMVPRWRIETRTCGVRHHRVVPGVDVSQWPTCDCGTFAVGLCRMCGRAVCGDDSARHDGSRMCRVCLEDARAVIEQRELENEQAEARRREEQVLARSFALGEERLRAEEDAIRRHGPCRAFPQHGADYLDGGGNCRACVTGLRR